MINVLDIINSFVNTLRAITVQNNKPLSTDTLHILIYIFYTRKFYLSVGDNAKKVGDNAIFSKANYHRDDNWLTKKAPARGLEPRKY